jgi:hypothetical protein
MASCPLREISAINPLQRFAGVDRTSLSDASEKRGALRFGHASSIPPHAIGVKAKPKRLQRTSDALDRMPRMLA